MVTARTIAETVTDPELPMITLAELGVLRDVSEGPGRVEVTITPTYTGCPALDAMRDDLRTRLTQAGYADVQIRTVLDPPWTTDWITEPGRRKLRAAG
ncbi:phenylacetate-CoA oxygenase subunit PaaJ, partial [Actinomadura sp. KC06]|uniref:1,2-phenylacetyl-CoA epoxidase subunit PaaD n=1 Tax=Actinomadura sp. KC06 TaxID=2530369 RepID=UPI0010502C29